MPLCLFMKGLSITCFGMFTSPHLKRQHGYKLRVLIPNEFSFHSKLEQEEPDLQPKYSAGLQKTAVSSKPSNYVRRIALHLIQHIKNKPRSTADIDTWHELITLYTFFFTHTNHIKKRIMWRSYTSVCMHHVSTVLASRR
jgi:hypothetical protein